MPFFARRAIDSTPSSFPLDDDAIYCLVTSGSAIVPLKSIVDQKDAKNLRKPQATKDDEFECTSFILPAVMW